MKFSELLLLYKPSASGASHAFSSFDLIRAIYLIKTLKCISRRQLSEYLEIGEGSTRTLLDTLREANIVKVSLAGCELSSRGAREVSEVFTSFEPVGHLPASSLTFEMESFCIIARSAAGRIASGITQRDAALLAGASGATVLIYRNGGFSFPQVDKGTCVDDSLTVALRARNDFEEGDVVVLSFAKGVRERERGAWAAIKTLD